MKTVYVVYQRCHESYSDEFTAFKEHKDALAHAKAEALELAVGCALEDWFLGCCDEAQGLYIDEDGNSIEVMSLPVE